MRPQPPGFSRSAFERTMIRPIAVSQSLSTSRPDSRTSGRVSLSGLWIACHPLDVLGIQPPVDPAARG